MAEAQLVYLAMQCSTSFGKTDPPTSCSLGPGLWVLQAWLPPLGQTATRASPACGGLGSRPGGLPQAAGCRVQGAGCRVQAAGCRVQGAAGPGPALGLGRRIRLPGGRGRLAPRSRAPEPPARREQRRGGRAAAPATYPAVRGGGRWARGLRGARGCERGLGERGREAGAPRGARAGGRDGFALPAASAFRAGPGKVGAARWPRGPGGKCGAGGRGPARTRGHTRGPQRGARLQVAAGGRGTQAGGGDGLASSPLRPRGPARSWGPLVASGAPVGKELSVVSCVAGSRTAPPGASFTAPCGALVLGKLSRPPSERSHKVTLTGSQLTVAITEAAAPECEEKRSLPGQRIAALPRDLSGRIFPASSSKDASA
ncbi:uncharacterized protein LOC102921577 [Peromyscus maniculatus bairdii]|uniref:uncharacterized protein LOC102921577 n=1 Tax=Peromyscus maniculatus bairdii TaxID=230844 RepID=UPI003FD62710